MLAATSPFGPEPITTASGVDTTTCCTSRSRPAPAAVLEELERLRVDGGRLRPVPEHRGTQRAAVRAREPDDRQHIVGIGRALELAQHVEDRLVLTLAGHVLHPLPLLSPSPAAVAADATAPRGAPIMRSDLVRCGSASTSATA